MLCAAATASAQARAMGVIRDTNGKAIKGATVTATNPDASPSQFTATSDDKGRWAMIGLRSGSWKFIIEAPGFLKMESNATMRVAGVPPLVATLARDPGPIPNSLDPAILKQLLAANALRDDGRFEQAIAAYQEIRAKNPKFTSVNLALGSAYRAQANKERDPAARRALLDRAIESYSEALKAEGGSERARLEIEAARNDAAEPPIR
jgi:tetratricopeptide (TPR) repeat protein